MEIILAEPRRFCAGVKRAVDILVITLEKYQNRCQVYVLHEIVHNKYIVEDFKRQGVVFVNSIEEIEDNGGILIFSAHGVSKNIEEEAKRRGIQVIRAICGEMASDVDVCRRCCDNFIVNTKIIKCDACEKVYHPACVNVKDNFSKYISECSNLFWVCDTCKECVTLKCIPTGHNTSLDSLQKDDDCLNREKDLLTKLLNELENVSQLQKFKIDAYEKQIHELKTRR
nr:unnamed protein product [Callosobruchus chinensis]